MARGLSGNAIITGYMRGGGAIRRQTALELLARVRGVEQKSSQLQFLRRDRFPDPRRLPEALTKLKRAFSFEVRIRGFASDTGEALERFVTVALDKPMTRARLEQTGFEFSQPEPQQYGMVVTDVTLVGGKKAGLEGTLF